MNPRDPLTERSAHSLRETLRDPYDWIEGTQEPQFLSERADPWHRRDDAWILLALFVLSVAAVLLIGFGIWLVFQR